MNDSSYHEFHHLTIITVLIGATFTRTNVSANTNIATNTFLTVSVLPNPQFLLPQGKSIIFTMAFFMRTYVQYFCSS